jgi:hypothetical protein
MGSNVRLCDPKSQIQNRKSKIANPKSKIANPKWYKLLRSIKFLEAAIPL